MKVIIIDDEPLAIQLLTTHIQRVAGFQLEHTFSNAIDAMDHLQQAPPDLLFLDIEMPRITGLQLLKSLPHKPKVIFTTAYRDYAIDAFNLDVIDYLLKPITFERFLQAINKAGTFTPPDKPAAINYNVIHDFNSSYIFLKAEREMVKVFLRDIVYIESLRDYVRIKMPGTQLISYNRISYLEQKLPENKFIRIHRSFIISLDRVLTFTATTVTVDGVTLPIGRNYKNQAMKALQRNNALSVGLK